MALAVSVFAVSAQKGDATAEPNTEADTAMLTLPLLASGEPQELTLEGTDGAVLVAFNATEGDVVDISMSSDDFDSYIVVFDWAARPVAMNDDGDGLDSVIEGFEIPVDGTYFVLATTFLGTTFSEEDVEGVFTIEVTGNTQPADVEEGSFSYQVVPIAVGDVYDVEIGEDTPAYFAEFAGEEGQTVTIDAPSEDLDTLMMLFDMEGHRLLVDDDGGDELFASRIELELPATGSYLLLLTTYDYDSIASGDSEISEGIITFTFE